jgi:predicted nuclease of predicted toxin-antitoxin system
MNLAPRWVQSLSNAGHDAKHWSQVGPIDASDATIFYHARNHGLILLTNDLDFPRILAHTLHRKPSIILLRGEPLIPETRSGPLILAISHYSAELDAGALLVMDWLDRRRVRLLPLR